MWNRTDGNKIISTHMKIQSYKSHLRNLKNVKSQINLAQPFKPTFSLSKRKNKYFKFVEKKKEKENTALLGRMLVIESEPMKKTFLEIPLTIPSNKIAYSELKVRERRHTNHEIDKENRKILDKIEGANSKYGKQVWHQNWKNNVKYRSNIIKKEYVPDYYLLVKEEEALLKSRMRPQTAINRIDDQE